MHRLDADKRHSIESNLRVEDIKEMNIRRVVLSSRSFPSNLSQSSQYVVDNEHIFLYFLSSIRAGR
jgi:hypothetical protein